MENPVLTQWLTQPGGLATRLTAAREAADLSGTALAKRLGWSTSKVSRIQSGSVKPSRDDVIEWLAGCGQPELTEELVGLLEQAAARHLPWTQRLARGHAGVQAAYNELMARSRLVTMVEMATIPGPVQTAGYTRAMLSAFSELWPEHPTDVEAGVVARMERGARADGTGPELELIINEAALLGAPANRDDMAVQLDHLLEAMDYPGVTVMVVELSAGMSAVPVNSFNWYHLADGQDLILVETFTGETEVWSDDVESYRRALDWLRSAAVGGEAARRVINRARWRD